MLSSRCHILSLRLYCPCSQTTPFLVENYDYEVRSQVRRINRHPSNIHWAAGNEVEVILLLGYTDPNFGPEVLNYLPAVRAHPDRDL